MLPSRDPKPPTPEETRRALRNVAIAVTVVVFLAVFVVDIDLERMKLNRKLRRLGEDLSVAQIMVSSHDSHTEGELLQPTEEGTLPDALSAFYVQRMEDAPYYHEKGRLLRLDLFSPKMPYTAPLAYYREGEAWVIVSRGPDERADLNREDFASDPNGPSLRRFLYDPSNGTMSGGDLWVENPPVPQAP